MKQEKKKKKTANISEKFPHSPVKTACLDCFSICIGHRFIAVIAPFHKSNTIKMKKKVTIAVTKLQVSNGIFEIPVQKYKLNVGKKIKYL